MAYINIFYDLENFKKTNEYECMKAFADIKSKYEVAIGNNPDKPNKIGKELKMDDKQLHKFLTTYKRD